jgi:hypothetical protein
MEHRAGLSAHGESEFQSYPITFWAVCHFQFTLPFKDDSDRRGKVVGDLRTQSELAKVVTSRHISRRCLIPRELFGDETIQAELQTGQTIEWFVAYAEIHIKDVAREVLGCRIAKVEREFGLGR